MSADNIGKDQLRHLAERRVRLEEEREALTSDIKEINGEAKSLGYSLKAFNAAIKRYRMTAEQREQFELFEQEAELYYDAIKGGDE